MRIKNEGEEEEIKVDSNEEELNVDSDDSFISQFIVDVDQQKEILINVPTELKMFS